MIKGWKFQSLVESISNQRFHIFKRNLRSRLNKLLGKTISQILSKSYFFLPNATNFLQVIDQIKILFGFQKDYFFCLVRFYSFQAQKNIFLLKLYFIFIRYLLIMGVYLSEPNKEKHIIEGQNSLLSFVSAEMQGWRKTMQDAAIHTPDIGDGNSLFAVFDGHGGFQVSKYVSQIFTKELVSSQLYKNKQYKEALDQTFKKIDQILESSQGQKGLNKIRFSGDTSNQPSEYIGGGVGCTANVLLITPNTFYVANSGDSRSVLCREGKAVALSEDHKPDCPIEEARIKKAGGVISMGRVNGGLNLTRSFGDFDYKRNKSLDYSQQMITCKPDVKQFQRKKFDQFILLGCDGIWENYVENNQGMIDMIKQAVKTKGSSRKVLEDLLQFLIAPDTMSGLGCDNMTAILILFKN